MMSRLCACALLLLAGLALPAWCATAFTYQGALVDGGAPAGGVYDLRAKLFDALTGGTQVGGTLTQENVTVAAGTFTISLDFGPTAFAGERWLELSVRPGASTGAFTVLSPRQRITPAPNALYAAAVPWTGVIGAPNLPPVPLVTMRRVGMWGELAGFDFDASSSYDPEGGALTYAWDLTGDGTFSETGAPAHMRLTQWLGDGDCLAAVRVRDAGGLLAEGKGLVRVGALAPSMWTSGDAPATLALMELGGRAAVAYTVGLQVRFVGNTTTDIAGPWAQRLNVTMPNAAQPTACGFVAGKPAVATLSRDMPVILVAGAADGSGAWSTITVATGTGYSAPPWKVAAIACATVDGRPALALYEANQGDLWFGIAATAAGGGPWQLTRVDATGTVGLAPSLAIVAGRPAIAYLDGVTGALKYAVNAAADGSGAWTITTVEAGASQPALLATDPPSVVFAGADGIRLARADAAGAWSSALVAARTPVVPTATARSLAAALIDGHPAAAVVVATPTGNALRYLVAPTANGAGPWTDAVLDSRGHPTANIAFTSVNNRPAVAYINGDTGKLQVVAQPY